MKIAIIKEHGAPNTICFEERPTPEPKASEVLIKVKAVGLNHLDAWVRRGVPGHQFPLPLIPGSDITGIVDKMGSAVKSFKAGDRVIVNPGIFCGACPACLKSNEHLCAKWGLLGETQDGGCREYMTVPENMLAPLPATLSFEQGACVPIAYVTAWQMLVKKARIEQGQSILIHGAGSGVSIACIQIAKLFGLQIFVTSSSDEKLSRTKNLGAHRFINTTKEPFREAVKNHTAKQGVDIVVDHVGQATFLDSLRCLKKGGKLVSCGATSGSAINLDWKAIFFKNISLIGSTYGSRIDFSEVLGHFGKGSLVPILDQLMKLDELPKAHQMLEDRKVFGKIVITF